MFVIRCIFGGVFDSVSNYPQKHPKISIVGATIVSVVGITLAITNPDHPTFVGLAAAGLITTIGTGLVSAPQAWQSFRTRSTKDLNLGFLLLDEAACALYAAYGVLINSKPLIYADVLAGVFALVPTIIKVREGIKTNGGGVGSNGGVGRWISHINKLLNGVKNSAKTNIVDFCVKVAAVVAVTGGVVYYLIQNPNITGAIGVAAAIATGSLYLPQLRQTLKTKSTVDLNLATLLISASVFPIWITIGVMSGSIPLIASSSVSAFANLVLTKYKVGEVLKEGAEYRGKV